MKKQYRSSVTKNHKIKKKKIFFDGVPLKGYIASKLFFRFFARNQTKHCANAK